MQGRTVRPDPYEFAASDLEEPRLLNLVRHGFPVYAWPYEDRNAWSTTRARSVRSVPLRAAN